MLWQDKEYLYNKATTVNPACRKKRGRECKKKIWFVIYRVITCLVIHAFFWTSLAFAKLEYLKFFTTWSLMLNMITTTLIVIAHLRETKRRQTKDSNASCTGETDNDSSSNDDSTFVRN